ANMYVWAFLTISNGDNIYVLDEDGRYKYNWTSERILEGLEFGAKLRNEDQVLVAGIEAFEQGNAALGFAEGWRIEGFAKGDHDVNYGVLPLPRGPQGKNTLYTGWFETFVLPSNVAQPEAMLALVDFLLRDPDIVATTEGMVEKRVNEWAPDAKGARVLSEVLTNYAKEGEYLAWTLASAEVIEEGYNKVMLGEKTAAEAMSAVAAAGQAYVDELLGYD
ncbi:MAG TPA: extracellular solute-binding protein, partial [Firmicutes bacterium]|nr:extracellular solute-binding protein [Bacillota bacterium]